MGRTKGSKDKKKREFYRGIPVKPKRLKNGRMVVYESERKRNDPYKIWFWQKKKMSYEGYLRFNPKVRKYLHHFVYYFVGKPIFVEPSQILSPEAIGQTAINFLQYDGDFLFMMPRGRKNTHHSSYCKNAKVRIIDSEEGLHAQVTEFSKMKHYKFWRRD